jgi:hypothetical protein
MFYIAGTEVGWYSAFAAGLVVTYARHGSPSLNSLLSTSQLTRFVPFPFSLSALWTSVMSTGPFQFMYSQIWNCVASLFPKQNYNVLSPKSYTHISVRDLYISRTGLSILLQPNECLDWQYSQFINIVGKDDVSCSVLYSRGRRLRDIQLSRRV